MTNFDASYFRRLKPHLPAGLRLPYLDGSLVHERSALVSPVLANQHLRHLWASHANLCALFIGVQVPFEAKSSTREQPR